MPYSRANAFAQRFRSEYERHIALNRTELRDTDTYLSESPHIADESPPFDAARSPFKVADVDSLREGSHHRSASIIMTSPGPLMRNLRVVAPRRVLLLTRRQRHRIRAHSAGMRRRECSHTKAISGVADWSGVQEGKKQHHRVHDVLLDRDLSCGSDTPRDHEDARDPNRSLPHEICHPAVSDTVRDDVRASDQERRHAPHSDTHHDVKCSPAFITRPAPGAHATTTTNEAKRPNERLTSSTTPTLTRTASTNAIPKRACLTTTQPPASAPRSWPHHARPQPQRPGNGR